MLVTLVTLAATALAQTPTDWISIGEHHNAALDYIWAHHDGSPTLEEAVLLEAEYSHALAPQFTVEEHAAIITARLQYTTGADFYDGIDLLHGPVLAQHLRDLTSVLQTPGLGQLPRDEQLSVIATHAETVAASCDVALPSKGAFVCRSAADVLNHSAAYWTAGIDPDLADQMGWTWGNTAEVIEADVKGGIGGTVAYGAATAVAWLLGPAGGVTVNGTSAVVGAAAGAATASFFSYIEQDAVNDAGPTLSGPDGLGGEECYGCFC